jgi:hypothetical protein
MYSEDERPKGKISEDFFRKIVEQILQEIKEK